MKKKYLVTVILSIICVSLLVFVIYYISSYVISNRIDNTFEEPSNIIKPTEKNNNTDNIPSNNTINKVIEKYDDKSNISNDQRELYSDLTSHSGGFYFKESVNINTISSYQFLKYVLGLYKEENNINSKDPEALSCILEPGENHYGNCDEKYASTHLSYVSKDTLDEYIKNKFNTNRVFTLPKDEEDVFLGEVDNLKCNRLSDYAYTFKSKRYYYGDCDCVGSSENYLYTKLLKVVEYDNSISFYDVMILCSNGDGISCYSNSETDYSNLIFEIFDVNEKTKEITSIDEEDNVKFNEDYIFKNYANKINVYKHKFIKENDDYYWYSSEIVK